MTGLLEDAQILGKGARGPNPTGMRVLTFGVQVADVAVDVETGEVRVERIAAIHDVGRMINPLGARSQVEGGIIQGVGHTLSEERLVDPASGTVLTQTLDAYKLPTIADVPEIVVEFARHPGRAPDEPRLEGARRAADHPDRSRDRERDPRRDGRRRPLAAGGPGRDAARAGRGAGTREALHLRQPESVEAAAAELGNGSVALAGGTDLVPLLRDRIVEAETLVDIRGVVPRGVEGTTIGAGTTLAELEVDPEIPQALREACSLAASPQLRSMGTIGGNLLQATRCWYWRLKFPCFLHGGDRCHARQGITASTRSSATSAARRPTRRIRRRRSLLSGPRSAPIGASCRWRSSTGCRPRTTADVTALEPGELILELEVPRPEASTYLKAMDRTKFSFALVGVGAARFPDGVRLALAGVAPIPWRLDSADDLERATPLPGTAFKVELARPLIRRALEALGA